MAAVISRVVALPVPKTEYLLSQPGEKPDWSEKSEEAFVFRTYGLADKFAVILRKMLEKEKREDGWRLYWFIHARTVEDYEVHRFGRRMIHRPAPARKGLAPAELQELEEAYR